MLTTGKIARMWEQRRDCGMTLTQARRITALKYSERAKLSPKERPACISLFIGESGIGKTATMHQLVSDLADITDKPWRMKKWHPGTQGHEDVTGLPIVSKYVGVTGATREVARYAKNESIPGTVPWFELDKDGVVTGEVDGYTLGLIDELPTAPPLIQDQIREMIDGSLNGDLLDPRCLLIATGNPPDPRFITVNALDEAIEKRLKIYIIQPSNEELLQIWSSGMMPTLIYRFLLKNQAFIDALSPREWVAVARDVESIRNAGGTLAEAITDASTELSDKKEVLVQLQHFVKFGEDPYYYPILGRELITATGDQSRAHIALVQRWVKDNQRGLVGESNNDLIRAIKAMSKDQELTKHKDAAKNIVAFAEALAAAECMDMVKTSFEVVLASPITAEATRLLANSKALAGLKDTVARYHVMRQKVTAPSAAVSR